MIQSNIKRLTVIKKDSYLNKFPVRRSSWDVSAYKSAIDVIREVPAYVSCQSSSRDDLFASIQQRLIVSQLVSKEIPRKLDRMALKQQDLAVVQQNGPVKIRFKQLTEKYDPETKLKFELQLEIDRQIANEKQQKQQQRKELKEQNRVAYLKEREIELQQKRDNQRQQILQRMQEEEAKRVEWQLKVDNLREERIKKQKQQLDQRQQEIEELTKSRRESFGYIRLHTKSNQPKEQVIDLSAYQMSGSPHKFSDENVVEQVLERHQEPNAYDDAKEAQSSVIEAQTMNLEKCEKYEIAQRHLGAAVDQIADQQVQSENNIIGNEKQSDEIQVQDAAAVNVENMESDQLESQKQQQSCFNQVKIEERLALQQGESGTNAEIADYSLMQQEAPEIQDQLIQEVPIE